VTVCRSANGTACGGTWNNGWIVFVDGGTAGSVDGTDEILRVFSSAGSSATLTANPTTVNAVQFQGIGLTTTVTFTLTDSHCSGDQRRLINVATSGRISTTRASCE
jgi:type IV fimbrial biogenesis protein FimT